jgi:hypothetical protein
MREKIITYYRGCMYVLRQNLDEKTWGVWLYDIGGAFEGTITRDTQETADRDAQRFINAQWKQAGAILHARRRRDELQAMLRGLEVEIARLEDSSELHEQEA